MQRRRGGGVSGARWRSRVLGAVSVLAFLSASSLSLEVRAAETSKVPALFESSFAHEATGSTAKALNDVLKILRLEPQNYLANLRAGWLYYKKGRYGDSVSLYRKARGIAPKSVEALLGEMLPLMAAKRWSDAERVAESVLLRSPRNYLASSRLAYIYFSQARYKKAELWYGRVLSDYPSDTEMMLGKAWTWTRQGRKALARNMFLAVLAIRRQNTSARAGLEALQ